MNVCVVVGTEVQKQRRREPVRGGTVHGHPSVAEQAVVDWAEEEEVEA